MILGGWCVSWWSDGVGVVGVGAGRGLRLGGRRFWVCHSWLVVGRFVVLVGWCRLFLVLGRLVLWAVGGGAVLPLSVVLVTVLVRAPPAVGDVEGEGAVGDALADGGVLTVGVVPRHSWRRFPWASLAGVLAPLVSLMSTVLYRVVSPWRLSLTLWVVVAEVVLSVAVSVMPVVRSLRALLWFTASLMLLMLLVVGVGLCVGGQWPVLGGGRWLVSQALSGRVCSGWCGLLVMLLVRVVPPVVWVPLVMLLVKVVQAMPRVVSWVRVVLVAPVVLVPLVTAWSMTPCGCFGGEGVVVDGCGRVPSPPLAGAWWFVGSPVVVALVSSGGGGCRWRR